MKMSALVTASDKARTDQKVVKAQAKTDLEKDRKYSDVNKAQTNLDEGKGPNKPIYGSNFPAGIFFKKMSFILWVILHFSNMVHCRDPIFFLWLGITCENQKISCFGPYRVNLFLD